MTSPDEIVTTLVTELKALRRSRGIHISQADRFGPTLRSTFNVTPADGPADTRRKIGNGLTRLAGTLPDDLQMVVLAAFGLIPDAQQPFYQERARWAAARLGRDERTVRRRMDEGIQQLAQLAAAEFAGRPARPDEPPTDGWHTESLCMVLNVDRATPEAFEFRRIVADRAGLTEIDLAVTLTAPPATATRADANLGVDVIYGGSLVRRSMETPHRYGLALALPRALDRGEHHDFALYLRTPAGRVMRPHFVCLTKQACNWLEVRVKFDEKRPPVAVWRLTKVLQDALDEPADRGEKVEVDAAGELHIEFNHVVPGFAYGVHWEENAGDSR